MVGDDNLFNLDAIVEYEMNDLESKAFKLCLNWIHYSRKIFPNYQHGRISHGDPRKSLTFKLCYKMVRESQGIIEEKEYPLYVRAQLEVLLHISKTSKVHPLVNANCLTGEKAWKRWRLWKVRYDSALAKPTESSKQSLPGVEKAIAGLENTKEFIVRNLGAEPTLEKYQECYINKNLLRWINLNKISPYYVALSPYISKIITPEDLNKINFHIDVYKPCCTEIVVEKFKQLFNYEKLDV